MITTTAKKPLGPKLLETGFTVHYSGKLAEQGINLMAVGEAAKAAQGTRRRLQVRAVDSSGQGPAFTTRDTSAAADAWAAQLRIDPQYHDFEITVEHRAGLSGLPVHQQNPWNKTKA